MKAVIWIVLSALAVVLPWYVPRWRLRRALVQPLSAEARAILRRNIPQYARMPPGLQLQLRRLIVQFLHQKTFVGCGGLELTDEMRVTVAGQACMLLLNRPTRVYPTLRTVLLYPSSFIVPRTEVGPGGVVTPAVRDLLGESWSDGRVILSWEHVRRHGGHASDGQNVVLHEFAHQLDTESGVANGAPYLGDRSRYQSWSSVLLRDFNHLRYEAMYRQRGVIDQYGATDPAEFFAVATEAFIEKPYQMAEHHADLFAEFRKYYCVDPRQWQEPPAAHPDADAASR